MRNTEKKIFNGEEIVYRERFASGWSQRNWLTPFGGARNCLRVIVTSNTVHIGLWFPFSLMGRIWDLEHTIPVRSIVSLERARLLWQPYLRLSYRDTLGNLRSFALVLRNENAFLESVGKESNVI